MGFAKTHSGQSYYLKGQIVDTEVDLSRGMHSFSIVGLPDKAVEEAKDRISAAIKNSGFISPKQINHKVVISLAPAHVKKEGSHFDLAMALGYLLAHEDISFDPNQRLFVGELSLDGVLRKTTGVLPIVIEAKKHGFKEVFIPKGNTGEAKLVSGIDIIPATTLGEVVAYLDQKYRKKKSYGEQVLKKLEVGNVVEKDELNKATEVKQISLDDIVGQPLAKRGLEIAAAGGHNILMSGPPGTGKTMLANALRTLLPKLSYEQSLEVTSIHSIAGLTTDLISSAPFRSPHHTSSYASLVGGGPMPRPGEVTLAHHGVLFLDELPEFDRQVIETLRQPLENRKINIARAKGSVSFPAHFILVAAMNPCPCGFYTSRKSKCTCPSFDIARYKKKISGPLLDRIDLFVEVNDIDYADFQNEQSKSPTKSGTTEETKKRIDRAREKQKERLGFDESSSKLNSEMTGSNLSIHSNISKSAAETLLRGAETLNLSMRSYHRVWRVARTIADLADSDEITETHVLEAFQFRRPSG